MSREKMRTDEVKLAVLKAFNEAIETMDQDDAVIKVAEEFNLPYSYVRTLGSLGNDRNDQIINAYLDGMPVEECATKWALSSARVRQIISPFIEKRNIGKEMVELKKQAQTLMVEFEQKLIPAILDSQKVTSPYETLVTNVGHTLMSTMTADQLEKQAEKFKLDEASKELAFYIGKEKVDYYKNFRYNAYKELTEHRNSIICKVVNEFGISATNVAKTLSMTRDRIYGILHESGIRTRKKLTATEKKERDESIRQAKFHKNMDVKTIADTFGLSRVTISTIINKTNKTRAPRKNATRTSQSKQTS